LSRAPPRNEEDHTHEAAYNTAIEQLNSQPKQWHPPGGTAEETIAICTTDNSQAVQDLQKQWDGKRWLVLVVLSLLCCSSLTRLLTERVPLVSLFPCFFVSLLPCFLVCGSTDIYAVQISNLLEALEEVAVPVEEDDVSAPAPAEGKKSRSRTVTTSDVKYLQSQMDKVGQAVNDATTMMTRQALGTAWTSLRRLLAKMHKAKSKAGIVTSW
jgi:flagellar hook-basal body complex protein FliE